MELYQVPAELKCHMKKKSSTVLVIIFPAMSLCSRVVSLCILAILPSPRVRSMRVSPSDLFMTYRRCHRHVFGSHYNPVVGKRDFIGIGTQKSAKTGDNAVKTKGKW